MRPSRRQIRWEVERGKLIRHVVLRDGRTYTHRCDLAALKAVCWYVEVHTQDGVTTGDLWDGLPDLPATQLSVALEFLKERGCVETRGRRNYPASGFLYEDALIEFHALEA
jgi:hypothetical protein